MRRVLCGVVLVGFLFVVSGCGTSELGPTDTGTATPAPAVSVSEEPASDTGTPSLGDSLTVGPLEVTPTKLRDNGIGEGDGFSFEPENGQWVAVWMRWENVSDDTIVEFPTAQIANSDGLIYESSLLSDPEPSLIFNMVEFKLPPGTAKEGWLTFDISGRPATLFVYMSDLSEPSGAASGEWDLTK